MNGNLCFQVKFELLRREENQRTRRETLRAGTRTISKLYPHTRQLRDSVSPLLAPRMGINYGQGPSL